MDIFFLLTSSFSNWAAVNGWNPFVISLILILLTTISQNSGNIFGAFRKYVKRPEYSICNYEFGLLNGSKFYLYISKYYEHYCRNNGIQFVEFEKGRSMLYTKGGRENVDHLIIRRAFFYEMFKGYKITIEIEMKRPEGNNGGNQEYKTITTKCRDLTILLQYQKYIEESGKRVYKADREAENTKIMSHRNEDNGWKGRGIQCNKTSDNTFLSTEVADKLNIVLTSFLQNEEQYKKYGLPHKCGILFYGLPGCGKTSTIYMIAAQLRMNIYKLDLGSVKTSRQFYSLIAAIPSRSILCINDIDIFSVAKCRGPVEQLMTYDEFCNRWSADTMFQEELAAILCSTIDDAYRHVGQLYIRDKLQECGDSALRNKLLMKKCGDSANAAPLAEFSLANLLDVLDGYEYLKKCIVIFTTNNMSGIDEALVRSGRIDHCIEMRPADVYMIKKIWRYYFGDSAMIEEIRGLSLPASTLIHTIILPNLNDEAAAFRSLCQHLRP